jgi:uncharacterized protein YjbI with pentapeptide repeats
MTRKRRPSSTIGATEQPDILPADLSPLAITALDPQFEVDDVRIEFVPLASANANSGRFARAHLKQVELQGSRLPAVRLIDVLAERIDASNGDWGHAELNRVIFEGCRLTGLSLAESQIREVTFRDCKLDYANFRFSSLEYVSFEDCVLHRADFRGAKIRATRFSSQLGETDFSEADLTDVDLRGCELGIVAEVTGLRGAIVDSVQLMELAGPLAQAVGIRVEDD